MKLLASILFAAAPLARGQLSYQRTPAGLVLSHCVRQVESGSSVRELADGSTLVTPPQGAPTRFPPCDTHNGTFPVLVSDRPARGAAVGDGLPPDYDGWLQYTKYENDTGFDSFLGSFTVPDNPERNPQILYLFTGLQNIDWIPKVDPEPSQDFDIIQPVIQYPADLGRHWSVKSWYVTLKAGALFSREIPLETGDVVFGNMTRTGADSWSIASTVQSSGKTTTQTVSNPRLASQPFAYTTLECYGCSGCDTYPKQAVNFTGMALATADGPVDAFDWVKNAKPQPSQKCNEAVSVVDQTSVIYTFQ